MDSRTDDGEEEFTPGPNSGPLCMDAVYPDGSWDTLTNVPSTEALIVLSGSREAYPGMLHGGLYLMVHRGPWMWTRTVGGCA